MRYVAFISDVWLRDMECLPRRCSVVEISGPNACLVSHGLDGIALLEMLASNHISLVSLHAVLRG